MRLTVAMLAMLLAIAVAIPSAASTSPSARKAAAATGVRLTLVDVTTTNTYNASAWNVNAATRTAVGTFPWGTGTYQYTMPQVIPASGATARLTMTIQANQNWSTGFSLSGNAELSQPVGLDESTSNRGFSYTASRDVTIKPRSTYPSGTQFVDIIGHSYYDEGPRFTFRYSVGAEPSNDPPSSSTPPSATPTNSTVTPAQAISLPSAKKCVSRRDFYIRLKRPGKVSYLAAKVTVNGKQVPVFVLEERYFTIRGEALLRRRLSARVDLRGLPKGTFRVGVTAVTKSLRSLRDARSYRTCEPKRS